MDYIIKNHKGVYIKLNGSGAPVSCDEKYKEVFEYSKARNILDNLPKPLKKLNFKVEAIPDIRATSPKTVIKKENYTVSDNVNRWIEKFSICDKVMSEAVARKDELVTMLTNVDRELSNELHMIELEKSKNACQGFLEYRRIKDILESRRVIKDEMLIITNVLNGGTDSFKNVNKAIKGLSNRKFTLRILEDENESM